MSTAGTINLVGNSSFVVVVNPCGNFSDTSSFKFQNSKGSLSHAFTVCICTENQNQISFYPYVLHEISVLIELILGHLRYFLTDVPPQPNSPPDNVFKLGQKSRGLERIMNRDLFFLKCSIYLNYSWVSSREVNGRRETTPLTLQQSSRNVRFFLKTRI